MQMGLIFEEKTMVQYDDLKQKLINIKDDVEDLSDALGVSAMKAEIDTLEHRTAFEGFWNDLEESQKILKKIKTLKNKLKRYDELKQRFEDAITLIEIADEENDLSYFDEALNSVNSVENELLVQKLTILLTGEYDNNNAIMTFHAGAGGTEAQDWVEMIYRMYTKYAVRHDFKVKVLDYLDGEEAGIKSASILIEGDNAYGFLKSEAGVHRLVRISPFDSSGRRHTSFASVEVMPEIEGDSEIQIRDEDLKVDTYRSGGAGGQHVNKTESAIRITHLPTGIVVACQNERSQHQNREVAMKMLRSKLVEIKEREHLERIEDIKGIQKDIAWGSQIRSYVFMPYTLVKDHRTNFESGNISAVMDGEIDDFINEYLKSKSRMSNHS